jgi:WbqC-like protein family
VVERHLAGTKPAVNCVILQPSYIPWRGYFHQIQKADVFVFYDDVQYDRGGWRNRNRVKTANGSIWLTIPVAKKGSVETGAPINTIRIDWKRPWSKSHWTTIQQAYRKAPYFETYRELLENIYGRQPELLADFTVETTIEIAGFLGLGDRRFLRSSQLNADGAKTDRLISILQQVGATHYISGPAARDYLEAEKLAAAGISLEYMQYEYESYPQLHPPFDPQMSIVDLLMMTGPEAPRFIWGDEGKV